MRYDKLVFSVLTATILVGVSVAQEWAVIGSPPPRTAARMIYDTKNERMVMFGGTNYRLPWGDTYNDVWTLDLAPGSEVWRELSPVGTPPSPRFFTSATYDSSTPRIVFFGGTRDGIDYFDDIWVLTLESSNEGWEELQTSGVSPSPRCGASAVYVAAEQRVIIFGGRYHEQYFNDVWSLDLVSLTWQSLAPAGTPPTARALHTAIYDPVESRMVVFGGTSDVGFFDRVWGLRLTIGDEAWTELSVSGDPPGEVAGHIAGYDCTARRMYIFGGYDYPPFIYPEDVFHLDLNNLEWTRISLRPAPHGRRNLCGDFDSGNRRLIVFGGSRYPDYYFGDTYALTVFSVGIEAPAESLIPAIHALSQGYPNPASGSMSIPYEVADGCRVSLRVFDTAGRLIRVLVEAEMESGQYTAKWDRKDSSGRDVPNGVYFYTFTAGEFTSAKNIILLR